jgi:Tfp pilus assembly protein PilN
MRPFNLIPPEERRGAGVVARTGSLSYIVVAVLAALLIAVTAVVLTNNKISDRKAELAGLAQRKSVAQARLDGLKSYAALRSIEEKRAGTVTSLAKSRFNWERVMRELSKILPSNVWLVNLTGTVRPDVQVDDSADIETRQSVSGPALQMIGCAVSQDAVARFVSDLEDIDGVTRVGVNSSNRADITATAGATGGGRVNTDDCRTKDFIVQFEIVAAFDKVAVPSVPEATPTAPPASGSNAGTVATQTAKARKATNLIP